MNTPSKFIDIGRVTCPDAAQAHTMASGREIDVGNLEFMVMDDLENPGSSADYSSLLLARKNHPQAELSPRLEFLLKAAEALVANGDAASEIQTLVSIIANLSTWEEQCRDHAEQEGMTPEETEDYIQSAQMDIDQVTSNSNLLENLIHIARQTLRNMNRTMPDWPKE